MSLSSHVKDLTGNIATKNVISYLNSQGENLNLNMDKWQEAMELSSRIFTNN